MTSNIDPVGKADNALLESEAAAGTPGELTLGTLIGNTEAELKAKAPKVYSAMLQNAAWGICRQIHQAETRRHQAARHRI